MISKLDRKKDNQKIAADSQIKIDTISLKSANLRLKKISKWLEFYSDTKFEQLDSPGKKEFSCQVYFLEPNNTKNEFLKIGLRKTKNEKKKVQLILQELV